MNHDRADTAGGCAVLVFVVSVCVGVGMWVGRNASDKEMMFAGSFAVAFAVVSLLVALIIGWDD